MIITLLTILLYALVALLVLALCFYIVEKFIAIPANIKQIVYAIVGVLFIIWIVQTVFAGGGLPLPPVPNHR